MHCESVCYAYSATVHASDDCVTLVVIHNLLKMVLVLCVEILAYYFVSIALKKWVSYLYFFSYCKRKKSLILGPQAYVIQTQPQGCMTHDLDLDSSLTRVMFFTTRTRT